MTAAAAPVVSASAPKPSDRNHRPSLSPSCSPRPSSSWGCCSPRRRRSARASARRRRSPLVAAGARGRRRGREILSVATARTRRLVLSSRHGRAGGPLVAFRGGAAGKAHFRSEHRFTAMHVNAREAGVLV